MRKLLIGWLCAALALGPALAQQNGPGFTSSAVGTPIIATSSAGGVAGTLPPGQSVVVTNVGSVAAYCQPGATATTSAQYIGPSGGIFQFQIASGTTQLTCITASGSTTLNLVGGSGFARGIPSPGVPASGPLATLSVYPETYGALGNGVKSFDGAVASNNTNIAVTQNSSTALNAPAVTTHNANDWVISAFSNGVAFSAAPTLSNTRVNIAFSAGSLGLLIGDQSVSSPGSVSAVTSTLNSATSSVAATVVLVPAASSSISFIGETSSSGTTNIPISLAAPGGEANGDYMVACFATILSAGHINSLVPTNSGGWSLIYAVNSGAGANNICFGKFAGASEPATYTFANHTGNSTPGWAAVVLDYRGTSGVENMNHTLSSASASFNSAMVGYPICVAGEFGYSLGAANNLTHGQYIYPQQVCGTITAVNSSTSINTSFNLPFSQSGLPIVYGADDTTALNTTFTSAPCSTTGCTVQLSEKHYIITGLVTVPQHSSININGVAAAVPNTANNLLNVASGGPPVANYTGGTSITMLSYNNSQAALLIGNYTAHDGTYTPTRSFSNFALVGGVGNYSDGGGYGNASGSGGGTDGLDIISQDSVTVFQVMVVNFSGVGVYLDGCCTAASGQSFISNVALQSMDIEQNGGYGVQLGSQGVSVPIEAVQLFNDLIESNGSAGICGCGNQDLGLAVSGTTLQWDNTWTASGNEISVIGQVAGGWAEGNYFETDTGYGSWSTHLLSATAGVAAFRFGSNFYNGGMYANGFPVTTFSAAGVAVPTANQYNRNARITVTDSTACVAGTTYASAGATQCVLISNGTNWLETGTAF